MQFQDDRNPYAPPTHFDPQHGHDRDGDMQILADRGTRWLARFFDGLLNLACVIPVAFVLFSTDVMSWGDFLQNQLAGLAFWACALPLSLYQWSLVSKTGQTLGKKWTGIRIVKVDGSPVTFGSGVAMREWLITAIGFIPVLGPIVSLVDILFIFGEERRCLHDHLAGTKVIQQLHR